MLNDFSIEYSQRSDDELLHLATQQHFLTTEARAALDAELRRRNLTESDRVEHQKFVKRQERREGRRQTNLRRRWERLGFKWQLNGREILELLAVMAVTLVAYFALPNRYHLNPDWKEAAVIVMLSRLGLPSLCGHGGTSSSGFHWESLPPFILSSSMLGRDRPQTLAALKPRLPSFSGLCCSSSSMGLFVYCDGCFTVGKKARQSISEKITFLSSCWRKILEPYRNCAGAERPAEHECLPPGQLR